MKMLRFVAVSVLLFGVLSGAAHGLNDNEARAVGLAQSYTALARGPEAVFWNPANLGLKSSRRFTWNLLPIGFTLIAENNSFSVQTYNDNFTEKDHFITEGDKRDLLDDIELDGLRVNVDFVPHMGFLLPLNGGVAFPLPWDIRSAVVTGFATGFEGAIPRDMFDLMLFGNDFNRSYDIAEWDGSGWGIASLNWAAAKPWMPPQFKPYLDEFSLGVTLKVLGGGYGEVRDSDGGFESNFLDPVQAVGTDLQAYLTTQFAGGIGFGLDLGAAGVTKDRKTTFSVGLLNLLDTMSWSMEARQDSVFATANDLLVTRLMDVGSIEEVLDNPVDEDGDVIFHEELGDESFSRSLPAMLRVGVAHEPIPRLTLVGNWDQAFTEGFGIRTTPRVSGGAEYRLVPWFPTRFGVSVGGRGASSAIGFGFGPFNVSHVQLEVMNVGFATRGGFLPGVAKGTVVSATLFKLNLI